MNANLHLQSFRGHCIILFERLKCMVISKINNIPKLVFNLSLLRSNINDSLIEMYKTSINSYIYIY